MPKTNVSALALVAYLTVTGMASAASFDEVERHAYGAWSAALYRNLESGQLFCALESAELSPVLRVNSYLKDNDTFLEVFDSSWSKLEGAVRFSIALEGTPGQDEIVLELPGKSWGDSYTFDILDQEYMIAILGGLAVAKSATVRDSNGTTLGRYQLDGSAKAVEAFNSCRAIGAGS